MLGFFTSLFEMIGEMTSCKDIKIISLRKYDFYTSAGKSFTPFPYIIYDSTPTLKPLYDTTNLSCQQYFKIKTNKHVIISS